MVPNIFHFIFGMAPDFGGKPFSLVHYLSVKSAVELNKPEAAIFHYQYEPQGEWWDKAKPLLTLNKIISPESIMGNPLLHVAHKADVVRLRALQETGGIYLDLDTISVRPLTPMLQHTFVIGEELKPEYQPKNARQRWKQQLRLFFNGKKPTGSPAGLCNAVLMAEPGCFFVNRWLEEYKTFRSKGRDMYWNEHSVQLPLQLAAQYPDQLTRLGPYAFHYPLYNETGLKAMFEKVTDFPEAYLHHLWESFSWNGYLSLLTEENIRTKDTTYNLIARRFL
jgi:Glycosyltransferase sugar-binding region containing DXD motif